MLALPFWVVDGLLALPALVTAGAGGSGLVTCQRRFFLVPQVSRRAQCESPGFLVMHVALFRKMFMS